MAAPTFVAEYEIAFSNSTSPKTTGSFDAAAGDVLAVLTVSENNGVSWSTPTNTQGAETWTQQQNVMAANYCRVAIWTAVMSGAKTGMTVSVAEAAPTGQFWGANVLHFTDSDGVGASSSININGGAPSLGITTTGDSSAICLANGDWNAGDGTTRTWRSVNGAAAIERTYFRDSSLYTVYVGNHADAGTAGAKTVGLSAPSGQKYTIAAVEILGTAGGGTAVTGTALGSFGFTGTAAGVPRTSGTAAAAFGGTFTAQGVDRALGVAAAAFGFTAAAQGVDRALGVAAAAFGGAFTAAGLREVQGTASSSFDFTGTASGVSGSQPTTGTASGAFGFTGTAAGLVRVLGAAAASLGFTATAAGVDRQLGTAAASFGFVATASGVDRSLGVAVAAFGFTGTASGAGTTPATTGVAAAAFGFTGTAQGRRRVLAVVAVSFGFDGTVIGVNLSIVTPPERTIVVPAEDRTIIVPAESRTVVVPADPRTLEA